MAKLSETLKKAIDLEHARVFSDSLESLVQKDPINVAIHALSEINAQHLDEAGIQRLTQLYYWTQKHQGSIFIKTVGKMDLSNAQAELPGD